MIDFLVKYATLIFTGLALALLVCSLFLPASASLTGAVSLGLIVCTAILRRARVHRQAFERGETPYAALKWNIAIEASVILVAFLLISAAGRHIGVYAGSFVSNGAEHYWPGTGGTFGLVAALLAAFAVGFGGWRLAAWAQARLQAR